MAQGAAEEQARDRRQENREPLAPAQRPLVRHSRPGPSGGPRLAARLAALWRGLGRAFEEEREFGHLFLFVPVFLGTGAVLWFSSARPPSSAALGVLMVLLGLAAIVSRRGHPLRHYPITAAALVVAGMLLADLETRRQRTVVLDTPVTTQVTGVVERRELGAGGEWRYIVDVTGTAGPTLGRPPSRISLVARAGHEPFGIGAPIGGKARLSPPSGPALPGLNDFAFSSYFDGVGAVGYFLGAPQSGGARGGAAGWDARLSAALLNLRGAISARIRETIGGDAGAFAAAIVTGERRAMSKETVEDLRRTGLAHVIAISGLHMALASGLFFVGLRVVLSQFTGFAQAFAVKKIAATGALLTAFAYLLISGAQVSAQRAFMMLAIMLVAVMLDRPAISLRNVALAAIVILCLQPSEVVGPSFQMSFAATVALIAGYAAWRGRRPRGDGRFGFLPDIPIVGAVGRFTAGLVLTSLIGGISTAIFSIEHFHRLAGYSLPANLIVMPIVALVVMPAALVAMILMPFGLDWPFLKIMGLGLSLVIELVHALSTWGGEMGVRRLPPGVLPACVCGMLLLTLLRTRLRHAGTLVITTAFVALAILPGERQADLLIAEDGALVALTGEGTLASNRARPPEFVFSQWREALQLAEHVTPAAQANAGLASALKQRDRRQRLPDTVVAEARGQMAAMLEEGERVRFTCLAKAWCTARSAGGFSIVTVEESAFAGVACELSDLVVTPRRLPYDACRSGAVLVTATTLRKTGSLELWLPRERGNKPTIRASFEGPPRAWNMHRRYDWRSGVFDLTDAMPSAVNDNDG